MKNSASVQIKKFRKQIIILKKKGNASEYPSLSVLSCMCLVSGTKTHELSDLYPSPSHSCFILQDSS